jgi:HAD superfamily hydrolase (TIGR01548 family)
VIHTLAKVRGVILDVDGVLLDARPSYHAVAEEAARRVTGLRDVPFDRAVEIPAFKAAGNFNDDWETARGIALLLYLRSRGDAPPLHEFLAAARGKGVRGLFERWPVDIPQAQISRTCSELYGGDRCRELFGFDASGRGMWENEQVLPDPQLLEAVAARFPLALYTGRNPGEAQLAQQLCRLKIPESLCWVADGRPRKPDPAGLEFLCRKLLGTPGEALFVGDTADDEEAARAARARGAPLVYAHVAAPGDTTRVLERLLAETGA